MTQPSGVFNFLKLGFRVNVTVIYFPGVFMQIAIFAVDLTSIAWACEHFIMGVENWRPDKSKFLRNYDCGAL